MGFVHITLHSVSGILYCIILKTRLVYTVVPQEKRMLIYATHKLKKGISLWVHTLLKWVSLYCIAINKRSPLLVGIVALAIYRVLVDHCRFFEEQKGV